MKKLLKLIIGRDRYTSLREWYHTFGTEQERSIIHPCIECGKEVNGYTTYGVCRHCFHKFIYNPGRFTFTHISERAIKTGGIIKCK